MSRMRRKALSKANKRRWVEFQDPKATELFLPLGDKDGNGRLSKREAPKISLRIMELAAKLEYFNEFPYFKMYECNQSGVFRVQYPTQEYILREVTFPKGLKMNIAHYREGFYKVPLERICLKGACSMKTEKVGISFTADDTLKRVEIPSEEEWFNMIFDTQTSNPLYLGTDAHLYINGVRVDSIQIPKTVTRINAYVLASNKVTDASWEIPNWIEEIGEGAFYENEELYISDIPDSVKYIAPKAFRGCSNLSISEFPNEGSTVESYAFYDCKKVRFNSLPSSIVNIEEYAFYNNFALAIERLPNVVTVGKYAFYGCRSMPLYSLSDKVTSIGEYAFYGCSNMILNWQFVNLRTLGQYAFYGCSLLNFDGVIPSGITVIPQGCFQGCTNIRNLEFFGTGIAEFAFRETNLTKVTIHEGCTYIGTSVGSSYGTSRSGVFSNCPIMELHIPNTVKTIGDNAFLGIPATNITSLPDSLESLGVCAFNNVRTSISELPQSLTVIGWHALRNNTIKKIKMPSLQMVRAVASWSTPVSPFPVNTEVYVPDTLLNDYLSDNLWKNIADLTFKPLSEWED